MKLRLLSRRRLPGPAAGMDSSADRFWKLAEEHMAFLYSMALRYTGNRFEAEDLVQDCYVQGLKNIDQLRDPGKMKSWLFAILRNRFFRSTRRKDSFAEFEEGLDYARALDEAVYHPDLERVYEQKVESEIIRRLMDRMPERYRTILLLHYMEEMTYREIADSLELPMGTVMSRLARAKKILKRDILRLQLKERKTATVMPFPKQDNSPRKLK